MSEIEEGFRKLIVEKHVVYYRIVDDDVEIVAILGAAMDPDRYFVET